MATTPTREVARRVFAGEFNDATYTFKESDDERAPVYLLLPTGERANRVFLVGTLMETEDVGDDSEYWQGQVIDPNGDRYYMYAGQYQPDAASMLRELEPPAYISVVGKPRTYETDDGEVNVSIRPESITEVDAATRDRWVVETAERTLDRIGRYKDETGEDGDAAVDEYVAMAAEEYDLPIEDYRRQVVEALESLEDDEAVAAEPDA
ncbi:DNA-binding protein [Halosimplex litoreum]|uniref:DNA-binding protein n=1 Tax=Halosimplex litoreum TaxID=1198301 RepID=A0A7T3FWF9_9EURY|nr:DNA-binding protein [Halosimplex litoreum]QPV61538.1 DNA-binding protein [Halosimplex litoreum]